MNVRLRQILGWIEQHPIRAIILIGLLTFLPGLGGGYLWDRDETWYAGSALTMVMTGDWLVPAAGERIFLEKPPLAYWLMAVSFTTLGVSEFAARLPSALLGIATLLVTYAAGAYWISRRVGLIAAGLLATCVHFGVMSRMVLTDGPLVLGMTAAMVCWWRMQRPGTRYAEDGSLTRQLDVEPKTNCALWCVLGGAAVGVAVLAKGPLGLLPGVMALVYVLIRRDFSFFVRAKGWLLLGVLAIAAVAVPWYALIYIEKGAEFFDEFILKQNLSRFGDPIQGHTGPFFYYIPVILIGFLPWSFLLLSSFKRRRKFDDFDLLLACWAGVPIVMFSLMATKLPHYIAMSFPPMALFMARELVYRLESPDPLPKFAAGGFWAMPIVALVVLISTAVGFAVWSDFPVVGLGLPGLVALILFGAGLMYWKKRHDFVAALLYSGVAMTLVFFLTYTVSLPILNRTSVLTIVTVESMKRTGAAENPDNARLMFNYRYWQPSVFYYSCGMMNQGGRNTVVRYFEESIHPGETAWVTVRVHELDDVLAAVPEGYEVEIEVFDSLTFRSPEMAERWADEMRDHQLRLLAVTRPGETISGEIAD